MKMRFTHPKAIAYLLEHGSVVTARPTKSTISGRVLVEIKGPVVSSYGGLVNSRQEPGFRTYLTGVRVSRVYQTRELKNFVKESGFADAQEWAEAMINLSGDGWFSLFKVELIGQGWKRSRL